MDKHFFSAPNAEGISGQDQQMDPLAGVTSAHHKASFGEHTIQKIAKSLEGVSPTVDAHQNYLHDPKAFLPLNSERLLGPVNQIAVLLTEAGALVDGEVAQIQKFHKRISAWEERIEKNKALIHFNNAKIKQNMAEMATDKKNRDYWYNRGEAAETDYHYAEAANRSADWLWLIKKYGLKMGDGSSIAPADQAVGELCEGEMNSLISTYRTTGNKYELARKDKETDNSRLVKENAVLIESNETLQSYITHCYTQEVEPLQDGVLLLKELGMKLRSLQLNADATYGDLRIWAESFLDEFLKTNPRTPQMVVTEFRRLASIPLPAENS